MPSADLICIGTRMTYSNSIDNDDHQIFESETVTVKRGHVVFGNILLEHLNNKKN